MFVVKLTKSDKTVYLSGGAGDNWVTDNIEKAFVYSKELANSRCDRVNQYRKLHGYTATVEAR